MMVSISPNPDASVTPSALLSPSMLDPEDNIVLKPINVAESVTPSFLDFCDSAPIFMAY